MPAPDSDTPVGGVGRLWQRLRARFDSAPIASRETLRAFLEQRASLIAQKCAIDYCRGKTGLASYALFTEKPFLEALDICRWESYVTVLGDLVLITEGHLRPHASAGRRTELREALVRLYRDVVISLPAQAHRLQGWDDIVGPFNLRLEAACLGEPKAALDVADHSARRLFDTLPIHESMRALDEEVIYGAVRFRMIAVSQEMERRLAGAELVRRLLD